MAKVTASAARVQYHAKHSNAFDIFNALTHDDIFARLEGELPPHRERLFPPTETLSMFVSQVLSADTSCQYAVDQAASTRLLSGLPLCSTATGGYCQARSRLPLALIKQLSQHVAGCIQTQTPPSWLWHSRRVRIIDGTTLTMPDTPANQAAYPQQTNQKPGLGFPICRVVAAFNRADGALVDAAIGGYHGKGSHEQALLRELLDSFESGDVILGDALYCTYFLITELHVRGMDGVFEQHGARRRSTDFRRGTRLGPKDHLITLTKPKRKPHWMSAQDYDRAPDHVTVRETRAGGKILVTTMCDARAWPKQQIKALYQQRWDVELNFRHLKETLNMAPLRSKTPRMNEKQLWVTLLAYNLIRWLMLHSAKLADIVPRTLSFKHSVQMLRCANTLGLAARPGDDLIEPMLRLVAQQRVGDRPGRIEPRAVKRRPKPYGLLMMPRKQARESIRQYGHPQRKSGQSFKQVSA